MDFLSRKTFFTLLKRRYSVPRDQYFWDALDGLKAFGMPSRTSFRRLEAATLDLEKFLEIKGPVFLFADHIAGWAGLGERRRHSPLNVDDLKAAIAIIRQHAYFRDKDNFVDNYYICNSSFEWFAVFCHENDWHLFIAANLCKSQKFESWAAKHGVRFEKDRKP
jgi:hypothetical protein